MTYQKCENCGGYAIALNGSGKEVRSLCLNCLADKGPSRQYVCSIEGCGNQPIFLAIVENDTSSSVLLCERHFEEVGRDITSYLEVPSWLTNGNDIQADEGGVVFEFEMDGK